MVSYIKIVFYLDWPRNLMLIIAKVVRGFWIENANTYKYPPPHQPFAMLQMSVHEKLELLIHSTHADIITILGKKPTLKQKLPKYITSHLCTLIGCTRQWVSTLQLLDNITFTTTDIPLIHATSNGPGTH